MSGRALIWFRRDLRLCDNPAFTAALVEAREVIPVFVFDRPLLASRTFGASGVTFMLECLQDLAGALAARGLRLLWRLGDPCEEIPRLARDLKVDAVYWNRDYEPAVVRRDQTVSRSLYGSGVLIQTFSDHLVFEPHELRNQTGQPFQRFSAFRAAWWGKWHAMPAPVTSRSARPGRGPLDSEPNTRPAALPMPSVTDLGYEPAALAIAGGERAARARLQDFIAGPLHRYAVGRNRPDQDATSILSPHFRFGTLSPRAAILAALTSLHRGGAVSRRDVHTWIDELVWRDFFYHVLVGYPRVVEGPFRESAPVAPPREAGSDTKAQFQAWCHGRTGYPIVDAGMRQLNTTGWMHNRIRMIVASFLVKDLRLDWREGERYFMSRLLDADLAVNNGNWQWCASTGTDAMPGYRMFNPTLQGKKFDPDGAYIRRYVPELAAVPTKFIHSPVNMSADLQVQANCRIGIDYPEPIVDHEHARREYLDLARQGRRGGRNE